MRLHKSIILLLFFLSACQRCLALTSSSFEGTSRATANFRREAGGEDFGGSQENTGIEGTKGTRGIPTAPKIYKTLARRSIGRYILASFSLFGECALVYSPAPFYLLSSDLYSRVSNALNSKVQQNRHASDGGKSPHSGVSYDGYMPYDGSMDHEKLSVNDFIKVAPPEKYSRVSSAFLVRHSIGDLAKAHDGIAVARTSTIKSVSTINRRSVTTHNGIITHNRNSMSGRPLAAGSSNFGVLDERSGDGSTSNYSNQFPEARSASVMKTLAGLRKGGNGRREGGDDLDLLSSLSESDLDEEDEDLTNPVAAAPLKNYIDTSRTRWDARGGNGERQWRAGDDGSHVRSSSLRNNVSSNSNNAGFHGAEKNGRNLVSSADERAMELLDKLREAAGGSSRKRKKSRRSGINSYTGKNIQGSPVIVDGGKSGGSLTRPRALQRRRIVKKDHER